MRGHLKRVLLTIVTLLTGIEWEERERRERRHRFLSLSSSDYLASPTRVD